MFWEQAERNVPLSFRNKFLATGTFRVPFRNRSFEKPAPERRLKTEKSFRTNTCSYLETKKLIKIVYASVLSSQSFHIIQNYMFSRILRFGRYPKTPNKFFSSNGCLEMRKKNCIKTLARIGQHLCNKNWFTKFAYRYSTTFRL